MFSRIKIWNIVRSHFASLRSEYQETDGIFWKDQVTYIYFPLLVSIILAATKVNIDSQVSNVIAIISIFGGFLLNLLAIINSYLDRIKSNKTISDLRRKYAVEINSNISYCIILSVFTTISLLVYSFFPYLKGSSENSHFIYDCVRITLTGLNVFLFCQFILTLLLVLSRVFLLLDKENKGQQS
jgi:hypothetical protein